MIGAMASFAALVAAAASQVADDPVTPVPAGHIRIAAGTIVTVAIDETISSKTGAIDQMIAIRLAEPILVDGRGGVPARVVGQGQVLHAAQARATRLRQRQQ